MAILARPIERVDIERPPALSLTQRVSVRPRGAVIDLAEARKQQSATVSPAEIRSGVVDVRLEEERVLSEKERAFEVLRERDPALTYRDFESALRRGTSVWSIYSPSGLRIFGRSTDLSPNRGLLSPLLLASDLAVRAKVELTAPEILALYQIGKASLSASASLPTLRAIVFTVSEVLSPQPSEEARFETIAALAANDTITALILDLETSASQLVQRIELIAVNARQELAARIALAKKKVEAILDQIAFENTLAGKQIA